MGVKISREDFVAKLKLAGQLARERIALNANEEHRLRFFYEKLVWSRNTTDELSSIIKEETLQNEIHNNLVSEGRGSEQELPT